MAERESRMIEYYGHCPICGIQLGFGHDPAEHSPNAEFLAWLAREHPEIKGADAMISAGVRLAAEAFKAGKTLG